MLGSNERPQEVPWRELITEEVITQYEEDGVVFLPQAVHREWLNLIELGIRRIVRGSAPLVGRFFKDQPGEFIDTTRNLATTPEFQRLLIESPIADMLGRVMRSDNVWLLFDHVFVKEGGACQRTPWHQDTPYWPVSGTQLASMWITLNRIPKAECLEFIAGSHRGPMYDGFDPSSPDPTAPYYGQGLPRLPHIEADRSQWDIRSWDIEPGDVVIFHPSVLHGGGQTSEGRDRWTLSVRCYGDDVCFDTRPPTKSTAPATPGLPLQLAPGDPLRHRLYPQLRPLEQSPLLQALF